MVRPAEAPFCRPFCEAREAQEVRKQGLGKWISFRVPPSSARKPPQGQWSFQLPTTGLIDSKGETVLSSALVSSLVLLDSSSIPRLS